MSKLRLACFAAALSLASAAVGAITPAQIPADVTSIVSVNAKALLGSPFWAAAKAANPELEKGIGPARGIPTDALAGGTIFNFGESFGAYLEYDRDAGAVLAEFAARNKTAKTGTVAGRKACFFHGGVLVIAGPRLVLILGGKDGKKGGFEAAAAKCLDPKAPKLAASAKIAKFLIVPAGQWAYGRLDGLDKQASDVDPQSLAVSPAALGARARSFTFKCGPGAAATSVALKGRAVCASPDDAAGLAGMAAMMKMAATGGMQGQGAGRATPMAGFLAGLAVTADGDKVNISAELPAAALKGAKGGPGAATRTGP